MKNFVLLMLCFFIIGAGQLLSLDLLLYRLIPVSYFLAIFILFYIKPPSIDEFKVLAFSLLFFLPVYLYLILSSSWSVIPDEAFRNAIYTLISVFPAFIFGFVLKRRYSLESIASGVVLFVVLVLLQAIYNYYQYSHFMIIDKAIMRTVVASIVILFTPIVLGIFLIKKNIIYLFGFIILLFLLLSSESRSSVLITIPAVFIVLYLYNRMLAIKSVLVFSGILLAAIFIFNLKLPERFIHTNVNVSASVIDDLTNSTSEHADIARRLITYVSLQLFKEKPVFGAGYSSVWQTNLKKYGQNFSAHGLVPGTLSEIGILGMSLFLLIIFRVIYIYRKLIQNNNKSSIFLIKSFFIGFISLCGFGLFHQLLETVYFALIVGIFMGFSVTKSANIEGAINNPVNQ